MILYFTATGNTQYAAQRIAQASEDELVSLRECMRTGKNSFHLKEHENFGIVAPTYFQGLPVFIREFLETMEITKDGDDHYAFAVATCGASDGNFGSEAVRAAAKANIDLDATFCVQMVDNWNPHFDMTDKTYIESAEKQAESDLEKVCAQITAKEKGTYLSDHFDRKKEKELEKAYEKCRNTNLFAVSDACIGCTVCAKQCPLQAIEIREKKPKWIKEKCLLCLGCVHKCPKNAISYTEDTIGHGQYKNPHIAKIV